MPINRYELVHRHDICLEEMDEKSFLTVGNGEFAYTVDVTGMQTLYDDYMKKDVPLCTMSQWGWHTTPVNKDRYAYTLSDVVMTEYNHAGRKVTYAVEKKPGNEEVYVWLRQNPHRLNLGRIGLIYKGQQIKPEDLSGINQRLNLYEGIIESSFLLDGSLCKVLTCCHQDYDTLAFSINSELLRDGLLEVALDFPYGSPEVSASDWNQPGRHETAILRRNEKHLILGRTLDKDRYYVGLEFGGKVIIHKEDKHRIRITANQTNLSFTVAFSKTELSDIPDTEETFYNSRMNWKVFWETGGAIDLHKSKDERAIELERRIVLSRYLSKIQCCGSLPPQETGLTCNSWHGKFHLEMYLWHLAYLPLWNNSELLERSLNWYRMHLKEAKENASRNGYRGAKWPKQVAYDAIDSPSPIATLLLWQQPHIIYMLELTYQQYQRIRYEKSAEEGYDICDKNNNFLDRYWELIKETADYMVDIVVYDEVTKSYNLVAPLIPAQESHKPEDVISPTYEVEYWRFTLRIAADWAKRLGRTETVTMWNEVADNMAELPTKDGVYLAHQNCPGTFEQYNKDHPSMLAAYGLIDSDRVDTDIMRRTMERTIREWDFATIWGWDCAMIAMTAVRLHEPEKAVDILLKDTPNNSYGVNGHNMQQKRPELPVYLPGNGSLLLAATMMAAGYQGCTEITPGFPKNGMWEVEYENISPFPY